MISDEQLDEIERDYTRPGQVNEDVRGLVAEVRRLRSAPGGLLRVLDERAHTPLADQLVKEIEAHARTKVALETLHARALALLTACCRLPDRDAKPLKNGNRWRLWTVQAEAAAQDLQRALVTA